MKCAIYIGPGVDVGKIAIFTEIKEWILIEELPSLQNVCNDDKRYDCFFLKLKKAFSLIGFKTTATESIPLWTFNNPITKQTVWYYHSTEFPILSDAIKPNLKYFFPAVDTIVHSGCPEHKDILRFCTNVKYYITSGDHCDGCNDHEQLQYELHYGTRCPFDCQHCRSLGPGIEMFYLPDIELSNLLFWNILWNRPQQEYKDEMNVLIEEIKHKGLTKIENLKTFYETTVCRRDTMRLITDSQKKFQQLQVNNDDF